MNIENWNNVDNEKETPDEWGKQTPDSESNEKVPFFPDNETINNIDFWYSSLTPNEELMELINSNLGWDESIDWLLAQNQQIQLLLSDILSDFENYIWSDTDQLNFLLNQEKLQIPKTQTQMIESIYDYMLQNNTKQWFERFLAQYGIDIIQAYLLTHLNRGWEFKSLTKKETAERVSKNEIKIRLKTGRIQELYKWYREKHTENSEALGKLEIELGQLSTVTSFVKNSVDSKVGQYLEWKCTIGQLAENLEGLLDKVDNNEMLRNFIGNKSQGSIDWLLRNSIKEYARLLNISDNNPQLGNRDEWDKIFNMQLRSYLYLYWIISHSEKFNQDAWLNEIKFDPKKWLDDNELWEILKSILMADWIMKKDWKNKYLASEQKLQRGIIIEDNNRRHEARKRIEAMKSKKPDVWESSENIDSKNSDIQNATWVEIARDNNLWREISGFERKDPLDVVANPFLQNEIFIRTKKDFERKNHWILSKYLDIREIWKFVSLGNNGVSFNETEWNKRVSDHPEYNVNDVNTINQMLLMIPNEYKTNLEKAWNLINEKKDNEHETIKNYAIGAVIDNIKDMLQNIIDTNSTWIIMTGFEFDEENSAKIENNCLLLCGKFNWETMNIKYDLNSWKLYMNSFINITTDNTIKITWNNEPNCEIWVLERFDSILYEFYKTPTESLNSGILNQIPNIRNKPHSIRPEDKVWWEQKESQPTPPPPVRRISEFRNKIREEHKKMFHEMCWTKLDEITWKVKDKVESKTIREPVALNLLRTLWIMPEDNSTKIFSKWSDLYEIAQLITSSNNDVVGIFSDYMRTFMVDIWLSWWENKSHQDKTGDIARIIFDKNNNQDTIKYISDNTENFDNEYSAASGNGQFDKKSNFWILKIIKEKFTEWEYPNWGLSASNIGRFKKKLEIEISESQDLEGIVAELGMEFNKENDDGNNLA